MVNNIVPYENLNFLWFTENVYLKARLTAGTRDTRCLHQQGIAIGVLVKTPVFIFSCLLGISGANSKYMFIIRINTFLTR